MLDAGVIAATSAAPVRTELFKCRRYELGPCLYSTDTFACMDLLNCPRSRVRGDFSSEINIVNQLAINGFGLPDGFRVIHNIDGMDIKPDSYEGLEVLEVSGPQHLLDAINVGALDFLRGDINPEYGIGLDRRIRENAAFQEKLFTWIESYGFPNGIAAIRSSTSGVECVHPDFFVAYARSGSTVPVSMNEAIISVPIIAVIRQLATIEAAARVLLGAESDGIYPVLDKIEVPCKRTLEKRNGIYRLGTEAYCIFDALALQILDMAHYGMAEGLHFCRECDKPFIAQGKAYYCGNPCNKDMVSKRRTRAKAKEAKRDGNQEQAP